MVDLPALGGAGRSLFNRAMARAETWRYRPQSTVYGPRSTVSPSGVSRHRPRVCPGGDVQRR